MKRDQMQESVGWIKVHRKINLWEWKNKPLTVALFLHILTNCNHKETTFRGKTYPAGCLVTGRKKLALQTGLSERAVRTSLNHLKTTNEVTIEATKEFSIISITNWNSYQGIDQQNANKRPTDRPTNDQQIVQQTTTIQEDKEDKKIKKKEYIPPVGVSVSVWEDFKTLRKAKRAPITETVMRDITKQAELAGISLEEALEYCISRNWQSFKADWVKTQTATKGKDLITKQLEEIANHGWD